MVALMSTPKHPPTGASANGPDPYSEFDPIPQPEVVEKGTDTTWQLWDEVREREHARYADTQPMTVPGAPSLLSKPGAGQPGTPLRPTVKPGASGSDKLMEECKRNNRVCPLPAQWQAFDALLRSGAPVESRASLAAPLRPQDWKITTSLAKRSIFRTVADWAVANGLTGEALRFLRALPEDQWHHMGD